MQPLSLGMEVRCTGFCLGMWGRRGPGGASAAGQLAFLGAGTTAATARALGSGRRSSRGGLAEAKEAKTRLGFSCLVGGLCFVGVLWGRSRLCEACHLCSGSSGIRCSWVEAVAVGAACKGKGRCRGSKQWHKSVTGVGQTQKSSSWACLSRAAAEALQSPLLCPVNNRGTIQASKLLCKQAIEVQKIRYSYFCLQILWPSWHCLG
jgi:hypothetical protein